MRKVRDICAAFHKEDLGERGVLDRFERTVSVLGRSQSTFSNYSQHVASISLYFGKIPTELDPKQIRQELWQENT